MTGGIPRKELQELGVPDTSGYSWRGPIELYGIFVELARQAFSESSFSKRRWNKDEIKSDVYIVPDYTWDDVTVEKRPAIFVSLGEISCDTYQVLFNGLGEVGVTQTGEHGAEHQCSDIKSGTVTWNILAETRGEALDILGELARYLNTFQTRICNDLCFRSFVVTQISPLSVVKEARERLQCSVSASFSYESAWVLVEETPKLKLDLHIDTKE